jgi:hypothetical protein
MENEDAPQEEEEKEEEEFIMQCHLTLNADNYFSRSVGLFFNFLELSFYLLEQKVTEQSFLNFMVFDPCRLLP